MDSRESLTIKKAEHQRIGAFELWCWRRLLRVPWTARRSNQFILKEISPGYSLVGLMLKLKLQYFGHLIRRTDSLEKSLMMGKIKGWTRRGWQTLRWLDGITDLMDKLLQLVMNREAWHAAVHGVAKNQTRLSNGTEWVWGGIFPLWFWFLFPWQLAMSASFHVLVGYSYIFPGEMSSQVLCPFLFF